MEPSKETVGLKEKFHRFISHPAVVILGLIGTVTSIIAFPLSFYFARQIKPNLSILSHPTRSIIVQSGRISDLAVSLRGKQIVGNLTAAQFLIHNAGKGPVRHEDILKPIFIVAPTNCPIFEATIRYATRDEIGFQLITNDISSGRLGLDWKILEENDGASFQILYGGPEDVRFSDEGTVVGQRVINFDFAKDLKASPAIKLGLILFLILGCITASICVRDIRKLIELVRYRDKNFIAAYSFMILVNVVGTTAFFVLVWIASQSLNRTAPFGF
jgi:hypothetical protein